jgi:hypothetical protein
MVQLDRITQDPEVMGGKVGLAAELLNAVSQHVSMLALGVRVLLELITRGPGVHTGGHEVMVHVAQHADNLRGQRLIENFDGLLYVALIALCHGALFHLVDGATAQLLNIFHKLWHVPYPGIPDFQSLELRKPGARCPDTVLAPA